MAGTLGFLSELVFFLFQNFFSLFVFCSSGTWNPS
uniref:Uncharacterized protein n=1 Tax=Anguilla anguilla TaxID=7936 RepID=A0A0E9U1T2_ANGAN